MKVTIEYCRMWSYEPRASGLEAAIRSRFPEAEVTLVPSSGGVFEVVADGRLLHSKRATGTFPADAAILERLQR